MWYLFHKASWLPLTSAITGSITQEKFQRWAFVFQVPLSELVLQWNTNINASQFYTELTFNIMIVMVTVLEYICMSWSSVARKHLQLDTRINITHFTLYLECILSVMNNIPTKFMDNVLQ